MKEPIFSSLKNSSAWDSENLLGKGVRRYEIDRTREVIAWVLFLNVSEIFKVTNKWLLTD